MKRLGAKSFVAALALCGVALVTGLWLAATPQGASWLLTAVIQRTGGSLAVATVEGSLSGHLLLTGMRVRLAQRQVEIDRLELRWQPKQLLDRTIALQELTLGGVRIQDDTPPDRQPATLAWPKLPAGAQRFAATIAQLRVIDLHYRRLQEEPLRVTALCGAVTWQDGRLTIAGFEALAPSGRISGSGAAGFISPSLTLDLVVTPAQPLAQMDRFAVQLRQGHATGAERFTGELSLVGSAGSDPRLEVSGELGMAQSTFSLRGLRLTRPGQRGLVTAAGTLQFKAAESLLNLQVMVTDLDLAPELKVATNLSGTVRIAGSLDRYQGEFSLTNRMPGWQGGTFSASVQGTRDGMKFAPLSVAIIDGTLAADLSMNWRDGLALAGTISARHLNPARIAPDWQGTMNFNLAGEVVWSGGGPVTGNLHGALLESRLWGQALTGAVEADWDDNRLTLTRLELLGKGMELRASGRLHERLALAVRVSDLSRLLPGGAGALQAEGWVRWNAGEPGGELIASGRHLAYAGTRVAAATLTARLTPGRDSPLHLSATLRDVARDNLRLETATVTADGKFFPDERFTLVGKADLSGGTLPRQSPDGELIFTLPSATATWDWHGEELAGTLSMNLGEQGQLRTTWQLPIPARYPILPHAQGPLRASLTGQLQERGLLSAFFPGYLRESFGELDAELLLTGTWDVPELGGRLRLDKAGAYLPSLGIHLKEVMLAAHLEKDLLRIDSFRARSGSGHLDGTALVTLDGRQLTGYQGTISGRNFQAVHFPELRILATPRLDFSGTMEKLTIRGEVRLPEVHISGAPPRKVIAASSDVLVEGRVEPPAPRSLLLLDVRVRLLLGKEVLVKMAGIDARLGGEIELALQSFEGITSSGEIKVLKGSYRTYGVDLEIVRGRFFFAGGPYDSPTLDVLALRTIGEVRAGVTVAGTLRQPLIKLYSEPPMPDVDILAYIVLGHPLGNDSDQAGLVARAAGALLTSGQAEDLQKQLKKRFGLSTLEIQGGVGEGPGAMGYKPLPATPPGAIPAAQQPGITDTRLTVGKYLSPQLYISYGKSLFTGNNLFRLRYDLDKQWQIETQTGSESGADLFYKLEFR